MKYTRNDSQYRRNRAAILATNPECVYCHRPANTVDHVIELDRWNTEQLPGSPHTLENMVPACWAKLVSVRAIRRMRNLMYALVTDGLNNTLLLSALGELV